MNSIDYFVVFLVAISLASLNSYYWYKQGYRGGKLFFLGTIAFFSIGMVIFKLFL